MWLTEMYSHNFFRSQHSTSTPTQYRYSSKWHIVHRPCEDTLTVQTIDYGVCAQLISLHKKVHCASFWQKLTLCVVMCVGSKKNYLSSLCGAHDQNPNKAIHFTAI